MLSRWNKPFVDQASDVPSILFFVKSCKILFKHPFNLFSYFFHKVNKMKIKTFEWPKSIRNYKKSTWSVKRLINNSFVPSAHQTSILYSRWRISSPRKTTTEMSLFDNTSIHQVGPKFVIGITQDFFGLLKVRCYKDQYFYYWRRINVWWMFNEIRMWLQKVFHHIVNLAFVCQLLVDMVTWEVIKRCC